MSDQAVKGERETRDVRVQGSGYYAEPLELRLSGHGMTVAVTMSHEEAAEVVRLLKPWLNAY